MTELAESLQAHAQDLAEYPNTNVLNGHELGAEYILDALAILGTTLLEELIADSTQMYFEVLSTPTMGTSKTEGHVSHRLRILLDVERTQVPICPPR